MVGFSFFFRRMQHTNVTIKTVTTTPPTNPTIANNKYFFSGFIVGLGDGSSVGISVNVIGYTVILYSQKFSST